MKVKKYVAPTMPEVMHKVKQELGSDAVILRSKEVQTGGFMGLFTKRNIEVTAAHDPEDGIPFTPESMVKKSHFQSPEVKKTGGNTDIIDEIQQLKKMISVQSNASDTFPPAYKVVYDYLLEQDVASDIAEEMIHSVRQKHQEKQMEPAVEQIQEDIKREMGAILERVSYKGVAYDKRIIHFIGPTGVGKTTTLAKVAAHSVLKDKKKVAFITVDTYRIAAIDQLKTYAEILDIPLEVAYNMEEYKQALQRHESCDLILVDTAGRNFRDDKYVKELETHIKFNDATETYLVLSLTAKQKDILEIYDQFKHLGIKQVIFTKMDETTQYGSILNIVYKGVGIGYLTNGQDVPDDFLHPSSELIARYIAGDGK